MEAAAFKSRRVAAEMPTLCLPWGKLRSLRERSWVCQVSSSVSRPQAKDKPTPPLSLLLAQSPWGQTMPHSFFLQEQLLTSLDPGSQQTLEE